MLSVIDTDNDHNYEPEVKRGIQAKSEFTCYAYDLGKFSLDLCTCTRLEQNNNSNM